MAYKIIDIQFIFTSTLIEQYIWYHLQPWYTWYDLRFSSLQNFISLWYWNSPHSTVCPIALILFSKQICVISHIYVYLETNYIRKTAENQICPLVLYMTVAEAGYYSFPISNENFIHQFNSLTLCPLEYWDLNTLSLVKFIAVSFN